MNLTGESPRREGGSPFVAGVPGLFRQIIEEIEMSAKRIIPIHHSSIPGLPGKPEEFAAAVSKRCPGTEVTVMKPGDTISV